MPDRRYPSCAGEIDTAPSAGLGHKNSTPFQSLREQACALAVMPNHLQEVAAATAKAKQMAAQRIAPKHLLNLQR